MLIITEKEVEKVLCMDKVISVVEEAYKDFDNKKIIYFPRTGGGLNENGGAYIILPASHIGKGYFGFKYASSYPDNPSRGVPTVASTILLCDLNTGFPVSFMGANYITAMKTASSPAVASKYLSRERASVVAIIGAGFQSKFQLWALSYVRKLEEIRIFDKNLLNAQLLADWYLKNVDAAVNVNIVENTAEAIDGADIVTTITTSFKPVFFGKVKAGTHINAMGSFLPEMQEIHEDTVGNADVIATDVPQDTWSVAGDLIKAEAKGKLSKDFCISAMGAIVSGNTPGRQSDDAVTLFESVGFSALDIAVAAYAYETALEKKIGTAINLLDA